MRAGICLVPEGRGVFASMSVLDNLLLGAHHNLQQRRATTCAGSTSGSPILERAQGPDGPHAERRRAADARHRPGAHVAPRARS
ncbi:MAG: hypothetical protein MZU95_04605 [Desulfomicrobium escambiense]|nr:hypothetical protein [Desulfomicrobium escambiense]